MTILEITESIMPLITLGGVAFVIYRTFKDPDIKIDKQLEVFQKEYNIKHGYVEKEITKICSEIHDIRENHLHTIENDVTKIFTILEERLPGKK